MTKLKEATATIISECEKLERANDLLNNLNENQKKTIQGLTEQLKRKEDMVQDLQRKLDKFANALKSIDRG